MKKKRNKKYKPPLSSVLELGRNLYSSLCDQEKHEPVDEWKIQAFEKRVQHLHQTLEQGTADVTEMMYLHGICGVVAIAHQHSNFLIDEMDSYEFILSLKTTIMGMIDRYNSITHPHLGYQNDEETMAVARLKEIALAMYKRGTKGTYNEVINLLHRDCIKKEIVLVEK